MSAINKLFVFLFVVLVAVLALQLTPKGDSAPDVVRKPVRASVVAVETAKESQPFLAFNGNVDPRESVERADACHTFHTFAHESESSGETDGIACAAGAPVVVAAKSDERTPDAEITTVVIDPPHFFPPVVEPPVVEPPVVEPPVVEEPEVVEGPGNPGNTRDVGNAGEDPNGRGTMPEDNAGGNGNGEHGNQGQGGNGGGNGKP